MSEQVIVEVDLAIHPYQGIIGCLQKDWTSWNEPDFIYYFSRDSPITFEIFPGDLILCEKEPVYSCEMGVVLTPIKKLKVKEVFDYLSQVPEIAIYDWDHFDFSRSVYSAISDFLTIHKEVVSAESITVNDFGKLASSLNWILKITQETFIFPENKKELFNHCLQLVDPAFKLHCLKLLSKDKIAISSYEILVLLFPYVKAALGHYSPSFNAHKTIRNLYLRTDNPPAELFEEIKTALKGDVQAWVKENGTENIELDLLAKSSFKELHQLIMKERIAEVERITILYEGVRSRKYDITPLRRTLVGSKLLSSLKISKRTKWADQQMFNLIEAALRKLGITLNVESEK